MSEASVVEFPMAFPERAGGNVKGRDTRDLILRSAFRVMIDEGYPAMSMRRVAAVAGIKFGNLTYHFPSREELLAELFDSVIRFYEVAFEDNTVPSHADAEERLMTYVTLMFAAMASKEACYFFTEMWAQANHDTFVGERMQELYVRSRAPLCAIVMEMRPDLSQADAEALAMYLSVSMEAMLLFVGYGKPYQKMKCSLESVTKWNFLNLIKTIEPAQIANMPLNGQRFGVTAAT